MRPEKRKKIERYTNDVDPMGMNSEVTESRKTPRPPSVPPSLPPSHHDANAPCRSLCHLGREPKRAEGLMVGLVRGAEVDHHEGLAVAG